MALLIGSSVLAYRDMNKLLGKWLCSLYSAVAGGSFEDCEQFKFAEALQDRIVVAKDDFQS